MLSSGDGKVLEDGVGATERLAMMTAKRKTANIQKQERELEVLDAEVEVANVVAVVVGFGSSAGG